MYALMRSQGSEGAVQSTSLVARVLQPSCTMTTPQRALVATYRLQVFPDLSLERALETLDYLVELGISHVYFSPYFSAHPGSTHGYDVTDFSRVHEGWGEAGHARLCQELERRGLQQVIDMVPNHMGVRGRENAWWGDVLANGEKSEFFGFFDIDLSLDPERKLVLAVLPAPLEALVSEGRVRAQRAADGTLFLETPTQALPFSAASLHDSSSDLEVLNQPSPLLALLARQHYRLLDYRTGCARVNYRRYLDVNELAALRVEEPKVFARVHERTVDWVRRGLVAGIRIDHPDGLADPTAYFRRLRELVPNAWVIAEKVLEPGHSLPAGWPVDGTTGYEFMNLCFGLFVDPQGLHALSNSYAELTKAPTPRFSELASAGKREVLGSGLVAEVTRLTHVAQRALATRELHSSTRALSEALCELLVAMPNGRTHRSPHLPPTGSERAQLRTALASSVEERPELASELSAIESVLSGPLRVADDWELCQRFQQLTAAVGAKGVEDTAFYRFGPLSALCDLGANPELATFTPADFHEHCQKVVSERPLTMNTTSTHDTKRGEDARLRIATLSELSGEFALREARWRRLTPRLKSLDAHFEHHLYQTFVGSWPMTRERLTQYALKAARETKRFTSWLDQSTQYEADVSAFIAGCVECAPFVADLEEFLGPVRRLAGVYSLAQVLLKLTVPGVPDVYQGSELRELHLVDPDNRRAVDFGARRALLRQLSHAKAADFEPNDERAKLWLMRRTLELRNALPSAFGATASYRALPVSGRYAEHVVAFVRGERAITVVPRLIAGLKGDWQDTQLELPPGPWRDELSGARYPKRDARCRDLFAHFPVALLTRAE